MPTPQFVADLVAERDHLTEMAIGLGDLAHEEERKLNDAERAQLAEWQEKCIALDAEIEQHQKVLESTRKWRDTKERLEATDRQRPARRNPAAIEVRSAGQSFIDSEVFKNYNGSGTSPNVRLPGVLETRAWSGGGLEARAASDPITTTMLGGGSGMTGLIPPHMFEVSPPEWRNPLLGLVGVEPVGSGSVEYFYFEPIEPPTAAIVPEGAAKPPIDVNLVAKAAPLQTYAHWKAITRQALEDFPRIQTIVEDYLRSGVLRRMETAIADAMLGNTDIDTTYRDSLLASIRFGLAQVDDQGFTPNAVLLNATDWATLDVALLGATLNGPVTNATFWGLTPVTSRAIPPGTAYVGDFRTGITFFDRRVTDVRLTDAHAGFFVENKVVVLAEGRGLAVVTQPLAVVKCVEGEEPPEE